jgi:ABC transporter substrate binding protein
MRRIGLAVVLTVGLTIAPLAVGAQQPAGKVYRIGYLRYYGCAEPAQFTELRQGLRDLGYAEGHNLVIECRAAPGKGERIPDLAAELVRLNVDVIVSVMVYIADPVASGLVSSLGRPGGNVTGSTMLGPEIVRKNIQLLKEAAPAISRVTVLIDSSNPGQTSRSNFGAPESISTRSSRAPSPPTFLSSSPRRLT